VIGVNESNVARDPCESEAMSDHNLHANSCKKDFEICCVPSIAEFRHCNLYFFMLFDLVFLLNSMR